MSAKQPKKSATKAKGPAKATARKKAAAAKASGTRASSPKAASAKPKAKAASPTQAKGAKAPARKKAAATPKKRARKTTATKRPAQQAGGKTAPVASPCLPRKARDPEVVAPAPLIAAIPSEPPTPLSDAPGGTPPSVATTTPFPPFAPQAADEHGEDQSEDSEKAHRGSRLVPTNAVHTTRRRLRRRIGQGHAAILLGGVALVALLVIGGGERPHDTTPLAHLSKARHQPWPASNRPSAQIIDDPVEASAEGSAGRTADGLGQHHLIELEEMLARLDLNPSRADGVVDHQTTTAIRLYQQIAGLPVDGEPSEALLNDMREVVGILEGD